LVSKTQFFTQWTR